jgi:hypothetical protein
MVQRSGLISYDVEFVLSPILEGYRYRWEGEVTIAAGTSIRLYYGSFERFVLDDPYYRAYFAVFPMIAHPEFEFYIFDIYNRIEWDIILPGNIVSATLDTPGRFSLHLSPSVTTINVVEGETPQGSADELDAGVAIHPQYRFPNLVGGVDIGEWIDWVIIPDPNHPQPAPVYPRNFHALLLNGVPLRQGRNYDFYIEDGSTRIVIRRQTVSNNASDGENTITAEFRVGGEVYRATQSFTYTAPAAGSHSDWAAGYLARAEQLGIIPSTLRGENVDMRRSITRAEFAGVAVMAFESLSERQALPAATDRFTDTQDSYVLRAYNAGLMIGVMPTAFAPDTILDREQTATALTRVFKSSTIPGWTMATDEEGLLDFTWPALFADDANISSWARESVYFMAYNGIILGTGNNMFSPRAVTTAQQAVGYAAATREQAVVIALRMLENLG